MNQRITDDLADVMLRHAARDLTKEGWGSTSVRNLVEIGLDLRDCRALLAERDAEIRRLKALSESQAEAPNLMEAGRL